MHSAILCFLSLSDNRKHVYEFQTVGQTVGQNKLLESVLLDASVNEPHVPVSLPSMPLLTFTSD